MKNKTKNRFGVRELTDEELLAPPTPQEAADDALDEELDAPTPPTEQELAELGWTPLSWAAYQTELAKERMAATPRGGKHHSIRA